MLDASRSATSDPVMTTEPALSARRIVYLRQVWAYTTSLLLSMTTPHKSQP